MKQCILVGIGGGTGAGKTTLVQMLSHCFDRICVVDLDSYYLDRSGISLAERSGFNFDEPSAIDVELLLEHLRLLAAGETVPKPRYSFVSHTRIGTEKLLPAPLILVEGLFALWWDALRTLLDLKVFVDAPPDLRLLRRIRRDMSVRGRSIDSILAQYVRTVRPMHERYVEPTRVHADLIVGNGPDRADCMEQVAVAIRAILSGWDGTKSTQTGHHRLAGGKGFRHTPP